MFTYPLQIAPANNVIESYIFSGWEKNKKRQCGKNVSRFIVVLFTCVVVVAMYDYISELIEIVAALTAIPMAFTLPPLFHLKIADTTCKKVADIIFIIFSIGIALYCAYGGTETFLKKLKEADS